jgi:hypothetical protein
MLLEMGEKGTDPIIVELTVRKANIYNEYKKGREIPYRSDVLGKFGKCITNTFCDPRHVNTWLSIDM